MARWLTRVAGGTVVAAGAALGATSVGGGVLYAGQLLPAPRRDRTLDIVVTVTPDDEVVLPPLPAACLGVNGLLLADGFLRYGGPVEGRCGGTGTVTRQVLALEGEVARGVPQPARFDTYVHRGDPGAVGLAHDEVDIATPLGPAPAWLVPPRRDVAPSPRWAVVVHGRSATREEGLRILPTLAAAGLTSLVITHRNDFAGGPASPDGTCRYGQAEWPDLAAAVGHAADAGAQDVVLVGFSQGGSLIGYLLRERGPASIAGIVLDAPLLSLPATLVAQARLRTIPGPLVGPVLGGTRSVARLRHGFDVDDVDHVDAFAASDVPLLVLHGEADDFVPIGPSRELARRRRERMRLVPVPGAGHVEAYNADPDAYTAAVGDFLARLPPG